MSTGKYRAVSVAGCKLSIRRIYSAGQEDKNKTVDSENGLIYFEKSVIFNSRHHKIPED
jgi:hypothetical protein